MKPGDQFGRWRVVKVIPAKCGPGGSKTRISVRCVCGVEREVAARALRSGTSLSCGCLRKERNRELVTVRNIRAGAAFRSVLRAYKDGAKRRGLAWSLTDAEFYALTQQCCDYCGAPPAKVEQSNSGERFTWNGVDRVDTRGPYTPGNTAACCELCNRMKAALPAEKFLRQCEAVVRWSYQV